MTSFFKLLIYIIIILLTLSLVSSFIILESNHLNSDSSLNGIFIWPLPNNQYISSYFGKRNSPTVGASSYHSGIDIPANEGTPIYSVCSVTVTFASWGAGGGYTIVVETNDFINPISVSYCHVSPLFLVSLNQNVYARASYRYCWSQKRI